MKWKGYPDSENTWEPQEHLDCPDLIQEFEDNLRKKGGPSGSSTSAEKKPKKKSLSEKKEAKKPKEDDAPVKPGEKTLKKRSLPPAAAEKKEAKKIKEEDKPKPNKQKKGEKESADTDVLKGFAKKLQAEKIIGATDSSGELMFLMKWKGECTLLMFIQIIRTSLN